MKTTPQRITTQKKPARELRQAPRLLGVQDAAAALGLSIWTIRSWAYSGRIASNKVGSRLMVPASEIDRIVAETSRPAAQAS